MFRFSAPPSGLTLSHPLLFKIYQNSVKQAVTKTGLIEPPIRMTDIIRPTIVIPQYALQLGMTLDTVSISFPIRL